MNICWVSPLRKYLFSWKVKRTHTKFAWNLIRLVLFRLRFISSKLQNKNKWIKKNRFFTHKIGGRKQKWREIFVNTCENEWFVCKINFNLFLNVTSAIQLCNLVFKISLCEKENNLVWFCQSAKKLHNKWTKNHFWFLYKHWWNHREYAKW